MRNNEIHNERICTQKGPLTSTKAVHTTLVLNGKVLRNTNKFKVISNWRLGKIVAQSLK